MIFMCRGDCRSAPRQTYPERPVVLDPNFRGQRRR